MVTLQDRAVTEDPTRHNLFHFDWSTGSPGRSIVTKRQTRSDTGNEACAKAALQIDVQQKQVPLVGAVSNRQKKKKQILYKAEVV